MAALRQFSTSITLVAMLLGLQATASSLGLNPASAASCAKGGVVGASVGPSMLQRRKELKPDTNIKEVKKLERMLADATHELCFSSTMPSDGLGKTGETAPLNEDGYRLVARKRSSPEMRNFVKRLLKKLDLVIEDEGGLASFLPAFDCDKGAKTFGILQRELELAAQETGSWVSGSTSKKSNQVSFAVHNRHVFINRLASEEGLMPGSDWSITPQELCNGKNEKVKDLKEWKNAGDIATLDEVGYRIVAQKHSKAHMQKFVKRMIVSLDLAVEDNASLISFLPDYDCERGAKSFYKLQNDLLALAEKNHTWVKFSNVIKNIVERQELDVKKTSKERNLLQGNASDEFSEFAGFISEGGELLRAPMTVEVAKRRCKEYKGKCKGFCHEGPPTDENVEVIFKGQWDNEPTTHWTSYKKLATNAGGSPSFEEYNGYISDGGDLLRAAMTVEAAKVKCTAFPQDACKGFVHDSLPSDDVQVIMFKNKWDNKLEPIWTSYRLNNVAHTETSSASTESMENKTDTPKAKESQEKDIVKHKEETATSDDKTSIASNGAAGRKTATLKEVVKDSPKKESVQEVKKVSQQKASFKETKKAVTLMDEDIDEKRIPKTIESRKAKAGNVDDLVEKLRQELDRQIQEEG